MATSSNAAAVAQLADSLAQASSELLDYRIVHRGRLTKKQRIQIEDAETTLDGLVAILRGTATRLIAAEAGEKLKQLQAQITHAKGVIAKIQKIKAVMTLVSALVTAAAALVSGDITALASAITAVQKANAAADKAVEEQDAGNAVTAKAVGSTTG